MPCDSDASWDMLILAETRNTLPPKQLSGEVLQAESTLAETEGVE